MTVLCTLRYSTGVRCREPASSAYRGRITKSVMFRCKEHSMGPGEMKDDHGALFEPLSLDEALVFQVMSS